MLNIKTITMKVNYLTLGHDCSPAAALKNLHLRDFALPFDWVVANVHILEKCFQSNFVHFHKNLVFNYHKTRLIDYYNFEFPHDYPLTYMSNVEDTIGEGVFGEENGKQITDKWMDYYDVVVEKYSRRIERFKNIINDTKPIIVLCRYNTKDMLKLQNIFMECYKLQNVYFVNSSNEIFENDTIVNVHTEKNNIWNEASVWKQGIDNIMFKILLKGIQ